MGQSRVTGSSSRSLLVATSLHRVQRRPAPFRPPMLDAIPEVTAPLLEHPQLWRSKDQETTRDEQTFCFRQSSVMAVNEEGLENLPHHVLSLKG